MIFKDWIVNYYTVCRRLKLKESTVKSYLALLRYIPVGWVYENLTVFDVQDLITRLALSGLSPSTVKHVFTLIRRPLIDGMYYGLPDKRDCVVGVELPRQARKHITSLSEREAAALLSAPDSLHHDAVKLLLLTGLRFGELAALDCTDIDIMSHSLSITKSYYDGKITKPKTTSSIRRVPLNSYAMQIVLNHLRLGCAPLFVSNSGARLNYRSCLDAFRRMCDRYQVRRCGLHVLRHTFATELFRQGENLKVVSGILGHASVSITADIYTDLPFELCQKAVCNLFSLSAL